MADNSGAVQQVVEALKCLYSDPNPAAKEKADGWLKEFQKSVGLAAGWAVEEQRAGERAERRGEEARGRREVL
jgi:hypothetical protein